MGDVIKLLDFATVTRESHQARGLGAIFQREFDVFGAQQLFFELRQLAIIENFAAVDDHDAAAEFFDVVEVVSSQKYGGVKFAIDGPQEMANLVFGDDV